MDRVNFYGTIVNYIYKCTYFGRKPRKYRKALPCGIQTHKKGNRGVERNETSNRNHGFRKV